MYVRFFLDFLDILFYAFDSVAGVKLEVISKAG